MSNFAYGRGCAAVCSQWILACDCNPNCKESSRLRLASLEYDSIGEPEGVSPWTSRPAGLAAAGEPRMRQNYGNHCRVGGRPGPLDPNRTSLFRNSTSVGYA